MDPVQEVPAMKLFFCLLSLLGLSGCAFTGAKVPSVQPTEALAPPAVESGWQAYEGLERGRRCGGWQEALVNER